MAWISVHEQVISGKLRNLCKAIGCSQNEALGILVRLWLWGINNADKDGLIIGADIDDIADVITVGLDKKLEPLKVVQELIETKWIDVVGEDFYFHDWFDWQMQWYKYIETKEKNAERKRKERVLKSQKMQSKGNPKESTEENKDKNNNYSEEQKKTSPEQYTEDFKRFWEVYPRKVDKGACYKKYNARLKDGYSPDELFTAAQNYAQQCHRENTEQRFIKHGKTFLGDSTPFIEYIPKHKNLYETAENGGNPFEEYLGG